MANFGGFLPFGACALWLTTYLLTGIFMCIKAIVFFMLMLAALTTFAAPFVAKAVQKKTIAPPVVTFKGVKFGSSIDEFLELFPESNCDKSPYYSSCNGGPISYLGENNAIYFAVFRENAARNGFYKLQSVQIAFFNQDPSSILIGIQSSISKNFGKPEETNNNQKAEDMLFQVSSWHTTDAHIALSVCQKKHLNYSPSNTYSDVFAGMPDFKCPNSYVYVNLSSKKNYSEKSPTSDF